MNKIVTCAELQPCLGHLFQPSDLLANEEVERHLGHKEAGPGSVGVVDGRSDVLIREPLERIDGRQTVRKNLVKNVTAVAVAIPEKQ